MARKSEKRKSAAKKHAHRAHAKPAVKEAPRAKEVQAEKPAASEKKPGEAKPSSKPFLTMRRAAYIIIAVVVISLIAWRAYTFMAPEAGGLEDAVLQEGSGPEIVAGDTVTVTYTGVLQNGTEFDSGELDFTVGAGQMIEGFDAAVAGMKEGGEKRFSIPPDKAYGEPDPTKVLEVPLTRSINKTVEVTVEEFKSAFGEDPVIGQEYFQEGMVWNIKVLSVSGDTMVIEHMPADGQQIESPYGSETVSIVGDTLQITLSPNVGSMVDTVYGQIKISSADSDSMRLDFNHPLAGKTLIFTVKVTGVTKGTADGAAPAAPSSCDGFDTVKSGKPVLDVFIMSYCPYGLQMQKAVLPVMTLLGDIEVG